MDAVLYYPFIEVPPTPWFARVLLYWDRVATIVPEAYLEEPANLSSFTRDLLDRELVVPAYPFDAEGVMRDRWLSYLDGLDHEELERRRRAFRQGRTTRVHHEKFHWVPGGLDATRDLGLSDDPYEVGASPWLAVESTTAGEYMAALALALTHPDSYFCARFGEELRWLPVTDVESRLAALLGGAASLPVTPEQLHEARTRGELRAAALQVMVLDRVFPVPDAGVDLDRLAAFKADHGDRLPAFRREIQGRVDEIARLPDVDSQVRALDRLVDECHEQIGAAEDHLRRLGVERFTRSPITMLVRAAPGVGGVLGSVSGAAEAVVGGRGGTVSPLAYAAFARLALLPAPGPAAVPVLAPPEHPLVDAFGYNR